MSILGNLLDFGGGDSTSGSQSSHDIGSAIGTDPAFGLNASDILHSQSTDGNGGDASSFTGIGDLGVGFSAPTVVGVNASSDQTDVSQHDGNGGGLLGGLL